MRALKMFRVGALRRRVVVVGCALVLAASVVVPNAAMAVPIQWSLQGVTFNDGTTASGSFFYDADTQIYSDVDITTSSGNLYGMRLANLGGGPFGFAAVAAGPPPVIGDALFFLVFNSRLTNAGGTVEFRTSNGAYEGVCGNDGCSGVDIERLVTAGQVFSGPPAALSAPGTLAVLGFGLAGLGVAMRRRIKRS